MQLPCSRHVQRRLRWPRSHESSALTIRARRHRPPTSRAYASIWRTATGRPWKFRRRRARANTGPARASQSGSWNASPSTCQLLSASTTDLPSRCAISKRTGCCPTGRASSTISSSTGRPTRTTSMSSSSATAPAATARRAWATPAGGGSPRSAQAARNRCFISTFRDRWRNRPMPAFPGCASSGSASAPAFTSGPSTAGTFPPGDRPSPRSILPCGRAVSPTRPHRRPARRLQHRRLAFARRPRRSPFGVPPPRSVAARTHAAQVEGWILGVPGLIRSAAR